LNEVLPKLNDVVQLVLILYQSGVVGKRLPLVCVEHKGQESFRERSYSVSSHGHEFSVEAGFDQIFRSEAVGKTHGRQAVAHGLDGRQPEALVAGRENEKLRRQVLVADVGDAPCQLDAVSNTEASDEPLELRPE
jgi:hypothetical protein